MMKAHSLGQVLAIGIATGAVVLSSAMPVLAQSPNDNGTQINLSGLSSQVMSLKHHALPANTPAAITRHTETTSQHAGSAAPRVAESPTLYPGDLSYQGGNTVEYTQSHPIYLFSKTAGCTTPACWGYPATFLQNLGKSDFIHVVDQYTGNHADNRYTVGDKFFANIGPSSASAPFSDAFMASIAHGAAVQQGAAGYGHVFHIFLPPGQDVCFTTPTGPQCYSPDVPSTFFFCAYHGSADFSDGTHVVYTVEPFQSVGGCNLQPGTPNGELVDSTMNVLSHEQFETITDPDGTAWWNSTNNGIFGEEIGDECSFISLATQSFDAPSFRIGSKRYAVQREYNNDRHACTEEP